MNILDQLQSANGITVDDEPSEPLGIWAILFGRKQDEDKARCGARRMQVISDRRVKVLALIREDGETSRKSICEAMGISTDTADADIEALKKRGQVATVYRGGRMFVRVTDGGRSDRHRHPRTGGLSMTDREMLELAALAAGKRLVWRDNKPYHYHTKVVWDGEEDFFTPWDPREDGGDAFQLQAACGMTVNVDMEMGCSAACVGIIGAVEPHDDNPAAATRLAIVRAAAEIGRKMKEAPK